MKTFATRTSTTARKSRRSPVGCGRPAVAMPQVRSILHGPRIQPKLRIGAGDDPAEVEADRIADQVMRMPGPRAGTAPVAICACSGTAPVRRLCAECEEEFSGKPADDTIHRQEEDEEDLIQTKQEAGTGPVLTASAEGAISGLQGVRALLSASERASLEPGFGRSFEDVRIHTGPKADAAARSINARALVPHQTNGHEPRTREWPVLPAISSVGTAGSLVHRYPRAYARERLRDDPGGPYPHLRIRGLEVDEEIALNLESALALHDEGESDVTRTTGDGWICEITEQSIANGGRRMRLLYIDDDMRTVRRAWQLSNANDIQELPEPDIALANQLVAAQVDPAAGDRAQRLGSLEPDQINNEVFDRNSPRGWHRIFPASTLAPGSIDRLRGISNLRGPRQTIIRRPGLTGAYTATPVPIADPALSSQRQTVIDAINRRLDSINTPEALAHRGSFVLSHSSTSSQLARGPRDRNWGWAYRVADHAARHPGAAAHQSYLRGLTAQDLGLTGLDRNRWEIFRYLNAEGDTSAINAYDSQMVTIGQGLGAQGGRAGAVYRNMPDEFHERLYRYGILISPDNTFTVLDLNRGDVVHGDNALRILQADERRLGALAYEAQSIRVIGPQGNQREQRAWMALAQFLESASTIPRQFLEPPWTLPLAKFALRAHHWQPSLVSTAFLLGIHPLNIATLVQRIGCEVWTHHRRPASPADYSEEDIQARMVRWASAARAGSVSFESSSC